MAVQGRKMKMIRCIVTLFRLLHKNNFWFSMNSDLNLCCLVYCNLFLYFCSLIVQEKIEKVKIKSNMTLCVMFGAESIRN